MYSVPEYLYANGISLTQDKLKHFMRFMDSYAEAPSDRSVKPGGITGYSKKSLNEGLLQFLL